MPIGIGSRTQHRRRNYFEEEPPKSRSRSRSRSKSKSKSKSKSRSLSKSGFSVYEDPEPRLATGIGSRIPQNRKEFRKGDKIKLRKTNVNTHFAKLKAPGLTRNLKKDNKDKLKNLNIIIGSAPHHDEFEGKIISVSRNSDKVEIVMEDIKENTNSKKKDISVVVSKRHFNKMFNVVKSGGKSKPKKKSKSKPKKKSSKLSSSSLKNKYPFMNH